MRVIDIFNQAARQFPNRPCLIEEERSWSYAEVRRAAFGLACWLNDEVEGDSPRIAVLSWLRRGNRRRACDIPAKWCLDPRQLECTERPYRKLPAYEPLPAAARTSLAGDRGHTGRKAANCPLRLLFDTASLDAPAGSRRVRGGWRMRRRFSQRVERPALPKRRCGPTAHGRRNSPISTQGSPITALLNLAATPISHAAGLVSIYMFALGASTVLIDRAEPTRVMNALEAYRVTTVFLPPTVIYTLLADPDVRNRDFSSLQNMIYAAAPMSVDKLKAAIEVFGPVMTQTFGQAEAPMVCTILTRDDHVEALKRRDDSRLASCGRPALLTQVAIVDDAGNAVPDRTVGEVVIRDLLMAGYFENEEATTACRLRRYSTAAYRRPRLHRRSRIRLDHRPQARHDHLRGIQCISFGNRTRSLESRGRPGLRRHRVSGSKVG